MIYKHVTPSGKIYIGQTKFIDNPNKRWRNGEHYKECPAFYRAIKKYGWDNIKHYIIVSNLTSAEADFFEVLFIKIYKKCGICYNINDGGKGCPGFWTTEFGHEYKKYIIRGEQHPRFGTHLSEETKRKLSLANKGKSHKKGWHHTKESIEKITQSNSRPVYQFSKTGDLIRQWNSLHEVERITGFCATNISKQLKSKTISAYNYIWSLSETFPGIREKKICTIPRSKECIEKWRQSMYGKFGHNKGLKYTEEQRKLMRKRSTLKKPVLQYTLQGEFIAEWESVAEASRKTNSCKSEISRCCKGVHKKCNGFIWRWKE